MLKLIRSKTFKLVFSVLLFVTVIILLYKFIDFEFFSKKIRNLKILFLIFSIIALTASYYFRVIRYKLILGSNKGMTLFSVSGIHYFLNKILPARTGEISLPVLLKRHLDIDYSKGISALFLFRILDVFVMLILFIISLFFIDIFSNIDIIVIISVSFILLVLIGWIFFDLFARIFIKLLKLIIPNKFNEKAIQAEKYFEKIIAYRQKKDFWFFLKIIAVSLISWVLIYFYYFFIICSFELNFNFQDTVFASSISNFTFILPINSVGNVGPFEAAWAYGFYLLGGNKDITVPVGLFANIFATLITSFIALYGYLYLKRKR